MILMNNLKYKVNHNLIYHLVPIDGHMHYHFARKAKLLFLVLHKASSCRLFRNTIVYYPHKL